MTRILIIGGSPLHPCPNHTFLDYAKYLLENQLESPQIRFVVDDQLVNPKHSNLEIAIWLQAALQDLIRTFANKGTNSPYADRICDSQGLGLARGRSPYRI